MKYKFSSILAICVAAAFGMASAAHAAASYQVLAAFGISAQDPEAALVSDGTGNLWGTTSVGGASNAGAIFKVDPTEGAMTFVASFDGTTSTTDKQRGANPQAELVSDGKGNLWGTTSAGGVNGDGTIFKVSIATGTITTLVDFDGSSSKADNQRGKRPLAGLVSDGKGNLWGSTYVGGVDGDGTVFKINVTSGVITTVLDFSGATAASESRGMCPEAGLASDGAGNLWGTTTGGGADHFGTVYKVNVSTGAVATVVDFDVSLSSTNNQRGGGPQGGLVSDGAGSLWGTTNEGGIHSDGTVFKIDVSTGAISTVVDFDGLASTTDNQRGANPKGALVSDGAGNLWGTTISGGAIGGGTIFKVSISSGAITTVNDFDGSDSTYDNQRGAYPQAGLVSDGAGNFWGTTEGGVGMGTVFKVNISSGLITTAVDFTRPAFGPAGGMVSDSAGNLWGTTYVGGLNGMGAIFRFNTSSNTITTIASFDGLGTTTGSGTDSKRGANPSSALISDGTGNFWGTTTGGGTSSDGTVFKVNAATGAVSTVADFDGSGNPGDNARGGEPLGGLASDGIGNLWGTTVQGGTNGDGTVFKISLTSGSLTTVADFANSTSAGNNDRGKAPEGTLVADGAGNLWGTTWLGGIGGYGTVFKVNISTGALTTLADFDQSNSAADNERGGHLQSGLVNDGEGYFWGTTTAGGVGGYGTLYKVNASTDAVTTVIDFQNSTSGTNNLRGWAPEAALASDGSGTLFGPTFESGVYSRGTLFKVAAESGSMTTIVDFSGTGGTAPGAECVAPAVFSGTAFYGVTSSGGFAGSNSPDGGGVIFSYGPVVPLVAADETLLKRVTGAIAINVVAGIKEPAGVAVTVEGVTQPSFGSVSISGGGSTVTYTPKSWAAFSGTDSFTYTLTDTEGDTSSGVITISNPFYQRSGDFAGTLDAQGGYLALAMTTGGAFTGKLRFGAASYNIAGLFAADGTWSGIAGGKTLELQLDISDSAVSSPGDYLINCSYNGTSFTAYHARYNGTTNLAPELGTYKVLIQPPAQTGTTQATANAAVTNGVVTGISLTGSGLGYVSIPSVTISAPSGRGAIATASVANGMLTGIKLTRGGSGYPATGVTVNIAPPSGNPIGVGYGTLTMTKFGTATLTGKLADGTAFTDALLITGGTSSADTVQVYVSLPYHVAGSLTGTLTFEDEPGVSDLDGTLSWTKPPQTGSTVALFQDGFSLPTVTIGSLYVAPKGAPALALSTASPNATITLDETGWSAPIVKNVTVATNNKVTVTNPAADKLALTISAPLGSVSGSFIDPVTGRHQAFTGVLFQKQTSAGGYFVNTTESGSVSLSPITISASIQ